MCRVIIVALLFAIGCGRPAVERCPIGAAERDHAVGTEIPKHRWASGNPSLDITRERDPRAVRWNPRAPDAIRAEIAALCGELDRASRGGAAEHVRVLWKLADAHAELARAIEQNFLGFDGIDRNAARSEAIRSYGVLASRYRSDPAWDEAVYFHALELELHGSADAYGGYLRVVRDAPQSAYAPLSRYGMGEILFRTSPEPQRAREHFEAVVAAHPTHPIAPFALARLGELADRRGDGGIAETYYQRVEREFRGTRAMGLLLTARAIRRLASP